MMLPLRVMSYNAHTCRGRDGVVSPERIARLIAHYRPDVVALQELDVNKPKTGHVDQPHEIARRLGMLHEFHPAFRVEEGAYGNAIISRHPLALQRAERLPHLPRLMRLPRHPNWRYVFEPRGALWVAIEVEGVQVQFLNTHLSLIGAERVFQAQALLGPGWLGRAQLNGPTVLCGDFNCGPLSLPYLMVHRHLRDAQRVGGRRPQATYSSGAPVTRLDHIFLSPGIGVTNVRAPVTALTKVASDHLPLIADLRIPVG